MMARIVSVADCFDAMTTNRPYQRAMTFEAAVDRINTFIGSRYDGDVVRALEKAIRSKRIKLVPGVNNVPDPPAEPKPELKPQEDLIVRAARAGKLTRFGNLEYCKHLVCSSIRVQSLLLLQTSCLQYCFPGKRSLRPLAQNRKPQYIPSAIVICNN
ncbi:MAG: hypothetical protein U0Y68_08800 [Blastocatellia bacterium]